MPRHPDFEKIYKRFVKQYGKKKGEDYYHAWLNKKGYDDTKPFPKGKEKKEKVCSVIGLEMKETPTEFHVEGLIATSHIDILDTEEDVEIPDMIPKETLDSFASQVNTIEQARIMGVHHSEGRKFNAEFFGKADIEKTPAKVIPLNDGEWGLYVDTKLLKNDPETPEVIEQFQSGELNSFSITYDTDGFTTTDFDWVGDKLVRILLPETRLFGYTAANNPVNPNAVATGYGFKEFKELVGKKEVVDMTAEKAKDPSGEKVDEKIETKEKQPFGEHKEGSPEVDAETKEFLEFKKHKKDIEEKEIIDKTADKVAEKLVDKFEMKEKVPKDVTPPGQKEVPLEVKEFLVAVTDPKKYELKEQFRRAGAVCDAKNIDWRKETSRIEDREFKYFGVNGRDFEFKGLGVTTNQNTDTDYLQSSAELQDVYDPVIYNALNQQTLTWNLFAKDDFNKKGNNMVQFTLKTAANVTATFYTGTSVTTANATRLKYQTKFKKLQVGISVDGDMIAAARGGPVGDVFAQEVLDATMDMLAVLNAALFAEVGLETAAGPIGFEFIADSAGNTTMYSLTRTTANKLSPDSATDTYINGSSAIVSMANLRAMKRQAVKEGANKKNLVYITNPLQGDLFRGKFDDARRFLTARDTDFGFSTDLFIDGIPVFEDKDCNTDDWWLIDLETHRVAIWQPPTIEALGKTGDAQDAFIKMYLATYNRAPRRLCMCYGNATS